MPDSNRLVSRRHEELANSVTHGIGLGFSLVGSLALLIVAARHGDPMRFAGCAIYATTLVAVYAASTLSHVYEDTDWRHTFRMLDQAFIYLLIVGTYTPLALTYLHGGWLWVLFGAMWGIALLGFLSKTIWRHRIDGVALGAYLLLGWMPGLGLPAAWERFPGSAFALFVWGGVSYTLGMVFLFCDKKFPFFHALWHVFVIGGSVLHYLVMLLYVAPGVSL